MLFQLNKLCYFFEEACSDSCGPWGGCLVPEGTTSVTPAVAYSSAIVSSLTPPPPLLPQVRAFCDVDQKKIQKGFYTYEESKVSSSVSAGF